MFVSLKTYFFLLHYLTGRSAAVCAQLTHKILLLFFVANRLILPLKRAYFQTNFTCNGCVFIPFYLHSLDRQTFRRLHQKCRAMFGATPFVIVAACLQTSADGK